MTDINTVIIDDEFFNRDIIKQLTQKLNPCFKIIGEAGSAEEGFNLISAVKPDLVFLDIKMPGENGFEMLKRFENPRFEVVFITGFDEYAIQAFEHNALDYILKPVSTEKFKATLDKIKTRFDNNLSNLNNLKQIITSYNASEAIISRIPVHHKNHVVLLDMGELMYVKANEGCTHFVTVQYEEYISSKKLADFEFILNGFPGFMKINRGIFINLNFIKSYLKGAECSVILKDGSVFEISRRRKTDILAALDKNKFNLA